MIRNNWAGSLALSIAAALAAAAAAPFDGWRQPVWVGMGAALALVLPSFWAVSWALPKPDKTFYTVFVCGSLYRLTGLALTAFWVHRRTRLPLPAVLVSLVAGFIALSCIEMYFVQRRARTVQ